jgi:hypothetical protein
MADPTFRVVLLGGIGDGHSREAAIAALSRVFQRSAADIARVLANGESQVGPAMTADEALALQQRLLVAGAQVRVDRLGPASNPVANQLSPPPEDIAAAGLMHCPACGHQQLVADRCDECGVVFAEYNRQPAPKRRAAARPAPPPPRLPPITAEPSRATAARPASRSDWLDDDTPDEQYHVKLFMGLDAAHLVSACERMSVGPRLMLRPSWTWGAVFSPFLWVLYRKMYAWSLVLFVVDVLVPGLLLILGAKAGISDKLTYAGFGLLVLNRLFWPAVMKYLYCRHTRGMVNYLNRMSSTFASDIDIATRGGTSRTSVFAGLVLTTVVMMLSWSIVDTLYEELVEGRQVFTVPPPPPVPAAPGTPQTPAATDLQDDLLVNENKWVATRNKLRVFGQRVNAWLVDSAAAVDPLTLDIGQIATALGADDETITDGWGNRIRFDSDGNGYRLISFGPDGEFGTSDDVEYRRLLRR